MASTNTGQVQLTGYLEVPPDRLAAVIQALPDHIALTRAEPGCISFEVVPSTEDPTRFLVCELFVDQAAFDAHQRRAGASAWARVTAGLPRHYTITSSANLIPMSVTILITPPFSTLCNAAFALRREVFVWEQKVPEEDEHDADDMTATHFVAIAEGEVVGTLRLIDKPEHHKIGRVAVRQAFRGRGIAKRLMLAAMDHARAGGRDRFYLTAQSDKLAMYEKLGFAAFGPEFMDGGMPHRAMRTYDRDTAVLTS